MKSSRIAFLLILTAVWLGLAAHYLYLFARGPESLLYCDVVLSPEAVDCDPMLKIVGTTITGSTIEFHRDGERYAISRIHDSGRRALKEIYVISGVGLADCEITECTVELRGPLGQQIMRYVPINASGRVQISRPGSRVLPLHKNTLNWVGDFSLVLWTGWLAAATLAKISIVLGGCFFMWWLTGPATASTEVCSAREGIGRFADQLAIARAGKLGRTTWIQIFLTCALLISTFGFLGHVGWPGLHWDAFVYAPPMVNAANGLGWLQGLYPRPDTIVRGPVNGHGYLHILLFGDIIGTRSWDGLLAAMGLFNGFTASLWFFTATFYFKGTVSHTLARSAMVGVMAGCVCINLQGRPEYVIVPITTLPFIALAANCSVAVLLGIVSLTCGLCFIGSPQGGAIASLGACLFTAEFFGRSWKSFCLNFGAVGLLSILTSVSFTELVLPQGFGAWLLTTSSPSTFSYDFSDHLFRFDLNSLRGVSTVSPGWNIVVIASGSLLWSALVRQGCWLGAAYFAIGAIALWPRLTDYGYLPWFPALCCLVQRVASDSSIRLGQPIYSVWFSRLQILYLLAWVVVLLQFVDEGLQVYTANRGPEVCRAELLAALEWSLHDERGGDGRVGMLQNASSGSPIVLGDASEKFVLLSPDHENKSWGASDKRFIKERGTPPPLLISLRDSDAWPRKLVFDGDIYTSSTVSSHKVIAGCIALRSRRVGYEYAIYELEKSDKAR